MANKHPKIGLALGSGGAKGLAHIGVLKSLEKNNIPVDYIAGSSIGSIIGAHYATYKDAQKLEEVVLALTRKQGMGLFDFTIKGGFVKGKKTEKYIAKILGHTQFEGLKIPLSIVATDFNTAAPVVFNSGNVTKAIRASIAVPPIYQPVFYLDKLLADGGLSNPVPVSVASKMGADITIAVNLDHVFVENPLITIPPLSQIPMLAVNILRHNLALYSVNTANIIISPQNKLRVGFIGWYQFFDNKKALQIIREGESATDKMIPEIKKQIKLYQKKESPLHKFLTFFNKHQTQN